MAISESGDKRVDARAGRELIGPVHGNEDSSRQLAGRKQGSYEYRASSGRNAHDIGLGHTKAPGVRGMDFGKGLGKMLRQARALSRTGHGVPMVAHAPGVQDQRIGSVGAQRWLRANRQDARLAVGRVEAAGRKEPRFAGRTPLRLRPLKGLHPIEALLVDARETADVEGACAVVLEG